MSAITRERLLIIQQWRETYGPGSNVVLPAEEAEELARIALASLEAEALAYIFKHPAGRLFWSLTDESNKGQSDVMPVYTAPPAPVSVPDESAVELLATDLMKRIDKITGERHSVATLSSLRVSIVESCRAAMLQGADGNSPVIPDGWVACSERMPNVGDIVLTAMGESVNVGEMERSGANYRFFTSVISGRELPATHWMPLPAAPQQEAKNV
ncbi:DUF551 domain-containing protein [Enterobacter ludwigii]|uniref:DUF551 domain-containing protein n=1 Tax=Enterobacter ludwigii TaxID=299767 RepID=UPI000F82A6DF|nr:DUF551 domain-containing protein [Enterobacter ludwigii]MCM7780400.1 DUF551 domain-containing protein [Enterobacter ludwigii]RTO52655.1 DUF551 domain-containing protein [Enterobacter ludwigii]